MSGARELGLSTSLALLAELVLAHELGLLTSLALLAGELVLATETETHFPLEMGIRFPLELETNTHLPLETGIHFPLELETNTCFLLVLNVLVLSALLSAPFVLSPTIILSAGGAKSMMLSAHAESICWRTFKSQDRQKCTTTFFQATATIATNSSKISRDRPKCTSTFWIKSKTR